MHGVRIWKDMQIMSQGWNAENVMSERERLWIFR